MQRILIITLIGIIGILLLFILHLFEDKDSLEAKLAELGGISSKKEQPLTQTAVTADSAGSQKLLNSDERSYEDLPIINRTSQKGALWRAKRDVEEIKELTSLDAEDEKSLTTALENSYLAGESKESRERVFEDILGKERLMEIENLQREEEKFSEEKEVADRIVVLSSALRLNESQKEAVKSALTSVAAELKPEREAIRSSMKEMMALHFEDEGGKEELRYRYDEMKQQSESYKEKRISLITQMLASSLTKDQLTKLSSLEADRIEGR